MYVCIYVWLLVYMYICMYVCMLYVCIYIYIYIYMYTHSCMHAYMHTGCQHTVCSCMRTHAYIRNHALLYTTHEAKLYIYAHTYTYIHTYTQGVNTWCVDQYITQKRNSHTHTHTHIHTHINTCIHTGCQHMVCRSIQYTSGIHIHIHGI
jgi:hypothetical protein